MRSVVSTLLIAAFLFVALTAQQTIVIRRAAGGAWSPSDIAEHWWAQGDWDVTSSPDIDEWDDDTGGAHLTQSTASLKPHNSGTVNSLACADFDGGAFNRMGVTFSGALSQPSTWFMVVEDDATTGRKSLIDAVSDTDRNHAQFNLSNQIRLYAGGTAVAMTVTRDTNPHVYVFRFQGDTSWIRKDGTQSSDLSGVGTDPASGLRIGGDSGTPAWFFDGRICEIFVDNAATSSDDISSAETYLCDKYGVTCS